MMRLLKFIGVFLLAAIVLFGFVLGLNWASFKTFLDNRSAFSEGIEFTPKTTSLRGLSEFAAENQEYTSLSSMVITHPDSAIAIKEHTPRAMGATANFFILAAYAYEFGRGIKHPDERVSVNHVQEYQLANFEQAIFRDAFNAAKEKGYIQNNEISLNHLLFILAEFNDLATADYLWWQIEETTWQALLEEFDVSRSSLPLPYSGLYVAISSTTEPADIHEKIRNYNRTEAADWREYITQLSSRYYNSEEYRTEIDTFFDKNRLGITFTEERDALAVFPKITSSKITGLLKLLADDELISPEASAFIKQWMSWPMKLKNGYIHEDFTQYGAIYDTRMGLLSGINLGTSAYTGDTTVQAFFLDQLPVGFWFHASSGHMHHDFMQRLIFDPAMIQQMQLAIRRSQLNTPITNE